MGTHKRVQNVSTITYTYLKGTLIYLVYIYIYITPWNRVLSEKLTVIQLVKKIPAFYGTRRSITSFTSALHLPYLGPNQSTPCLPILLLEDPFQYYPPIYAQVFQVNVFLQVSPPKPIMQLICLPYVPYAPPTLFLLRKLKPTFYVQ